jgi:hypothetical protein
MHLDLSDDESAALIRELHDIVESDRTPSPVASALLERSSGSSNQSPFAEPLPPPKVYAPPSKRRYRS